MRRRSTAAAVQHGGLLWKLASLGSPRTYALLWARKLSRSSYLWCVSPPWQCMPAHGIADSKVAENFAIRKCWKFPHEAGVWFPATSICFPPYWALLKASFHLRWKRQACYHHVAAQREHDFLYIRDGLTYHTLWQVPQTIKGLCWKIAYKWHLHSVLSASSIQFLPLVCQYCKLNLWPTFVI